MKTEHLFQYWNSAGNPILAEGKAGVYILFWKQYLFPPAFRKVNFSRSRDISFFDSNSALFVLILPYFTLILPFYFPFSLFLCPFFLFLSSFFLFLLNFLFFLPLFIFFPKRHQLIFMLPPWGGGGIFQYIGPWGKDCWGLGPWTTYGTYLGGRKRRWGCLPRWDRAPAQQTGHSQTWSVCKGRQGAKWGT